MSCNDAHYTGENMLQKKITMLQKCLDTKVSAFNTLEVIYFKTRHSEEIMRKHLSKVEERLHMLHQRVNQLETENLALKNKVHELNAENRMLSDRHLNLLKEKEKENELHEILMHQPISINEPEEKKKDCTSDTSKAIDHLTRQVNNLLCEKQALRTNMYWLTKELCSARERYQIPAADRHGNHLEEGSSKTVNPNFLCQFVHSINKKVEFLTQNLEKNALLIIQLQLDVKKNRDSSVYNACKESLCRFEAVESSGKYDSDVNEAIQLKKNVSYERHLEKIDFVNTDVIKSNRDKKYQIALEKV